MEKNVTTRIAIHEPDEEHLRKALADRDVSRELLEFLQNLLNANKWTRKINIPSNHDDLAAVLVHTATLKESGLEILSELHVFCAGKVMVEKWQIVGENEPTSQLPEEAFRAISIDKVRLQGDQVTVECSVPTPDGPNRKLVKTFDFSVEVHEERTVPHPLLECEPLR